MRYLGLIGILLCLGASQAAAGEIVWCNDATAGNVVDLNSEPSIDDDA